MVVVALANKIVRICWKVLTKDAGVRPERTRSTICRLNSRVYWTALLAIVNSFNPIIEVSTEPGQVHTPLPGTSAGNVDSPLKSALDVIRDSRALIRSIVDYAGSTVQSYRRDFLGWYVPRGAFLSAGPPRIRTARATLYERTNAGVPEVRIGLRLLSGLPEKHGRAIEAAQSTGPFTSVDHLSLRAHLSRRSLAQLAQAGALESLVGHRRHAHWSAIGLERLPGILEGRSDREPPVRLPAPTEGQLAGGGSRLIRGIFVS